MERAEEAVAPRILLERKWCKTNYTIGRIYVDGNLWFNSLEDTDRDLHQSMTTVAIKARKVYGQTAIPKGTYEIVLTVSPKFAKKPWAAKYGGLVPELQRVKGFSGIRIHPFNKPEESYGCIGPGNNTIVGQITNSTQCYYRMMDEIFVPAYESGERVYIKIF